MTEPDPLLDVNEVASYLGVTSRTVYREHKRGRLRFAAPGRIAQSEVDRYLAAGEWEVEPEPPLPDRWTLYRFFDADGALLYVGMTGQGATRWHHHSKNQSWWTEVTTITVEHHPSLEAVAAAEVAAIRAELPRYNVKDRPR